MNSLQQIGYVIAILLGIAYILIPRRIHKFGFDFLRSSRPKQSEKSTAIFWVYRGLGVLLLIIGFSGLL
ncbi:hypothetical protein E6P09_11715 [Haloferax mediterranei ATCC 33500]|uniref:Uncharacterized protein n=1 Tax=Haloferax mediterranei (strain ATCC 33500 / DSM 1411 / JCM 8866 / NBRC 14739 / NCIMB 2177 / R-4) TaxID=523841 RepID=A0A4P8P4C9_HALMT|nr:hypothetical protein E6P09_11715 [Haloferax mediterranei ATCC 33500]